MPDRKLLYKNADGLDQGHDEDNDSAKFKTVKIGDTELTEALLLELLSNSGDGSAARPYQSLNVKVVPAGKYHLVKENHESVVTNTQTVTGNLIVDGVNTIL